MESPRISTSEVGYWLAARTISTIKSTTGPEVSAVAATPCESKREVGIGTSQRRGSAAGEPATTVNNRT